MKTFTLDFLARCKTNGVLASSTGGPLGRLIALAAVLKKIEFPEELQPAASAELAKVSANQPFNKQFAAVTVEIEDAQADFLAAEIEDALCKSAKLTVADLHQWAGKLLEDLKAKGPA